MRIRDAADEGDGLIQIAQSAAKKRALQPSIAVATSSAKSRTNQ